MLQLMQRLLAGSLSRPRMIRSCLSSSLTRLPIAAGSPRASKPCEPTAEQTESHPRTPQKCPEIRPDPPPESPRPNLPGPHLRTAAPSLLSSSVRAASEREIPRARARPRRGGGCGSGEQKARLFCCCWGCFAARAITRGREKKLFPRGGFRGGGTGGGGEVTGRVEEWGRGGCRSAAEIGRASCRERV